MDKRFLAIIGVLLIIFVGYLAFGNKKDTPVASTAQPTSHTRGQGNSGVVLVEYGDFQCPACGAYYPIIEQVYAKYQDQITFQFRHFPLISLHKNAFGGSRAAEAASKQGKFWDMYDKLYSNQNDWSNLSNPNVVFESYASALGLDVTKFKTDFKSTPVGSAINADMDAGNKLKINSTPTFVLDGKVLKNPGVTVEAFGKVIEDAIAAKTKQQ